MRMIRSKRWVVGLIFVLTVIAARLSNVREHISLGNFHVYKHGLIAWVNDHYLQAVIGYIVLYIIAVVSWIPVAALLTMIGGFLFGAMYATVYVNIGATIGALCSFLFVRYVVGDWFQERFAHRLVEFNRALAEDGIFYLLAIHFIAVVPFSVVNILLGLTQVSWWDFVWTTSLGILPGTFVYAYAGQQLAAVTRIQDILSFNVIGAFVLLGLLALLPLAYKKYRARKEGV